MRQPRVVGAIDHEIFYYPIQILDYISQVGPDCILFEGELMRYMPGFKYQYQQRYCLVTNTEFKYYKNELMSYKHVFPLQSINLDSIEKVQRVNQDVPIQDFAENVFNQYQFEIFLKTSLEKTMDSLRMPYNFIEE